MSKNPQNAGTSRNWFPGSGRCIDIRARVEPQLYVRRYRNLPEPRYLEGACGND
jgi:hypothetical protein